MALIASLGQRERLSSHCLPGSCLTGSPPRAASQETKAAALSSGSGEPFSSAYVPGSLARSLRGLAGPPQGPLSAGSLSSLLPWLAERASVPGELRVPFMTVHLARGFGAGRLAHNHGPCSGHAVSSDSGTKGADANGRECVDRGSSPGTVPEEIHAQRFSSCP